MDINSVWNSIYAYFTTAFPRPFLIIAIITIVFALYKFITKLIEYSAKKTTPSMMKQRKIVKIWKYVFWGGMSLFILFNYSNSLSSTFASATFMGFLGMLLGWSLQKPVTGMAAWLFISISKPFKIGDRVIIAGIIGDVKKIGLMYVVMEQVGGTIGGEEQSGRGILIPTAVLFDQIVTNYRLETKITSGKSYILDEVPVRITFQSDWDITEKILVDAAAIVTKDIIAETGERPFLRAEFLDWGVLIRLRYLTIPVDRQRISSEIVEIIFREFFRTDKVEFCYPHWEILWSSKKSPKAKLNQAV